MTFQLWFRVDWSYGSCALHFLSLCLTIVWNCFEIQSVLYKLYPGLAFFCDHENIVFILKQVVVYWLECQSQSCYHGYVTHCHFLVQDTIYPIYLSTGWFQVQVQGWSINQNSNFHFITQPKFLWPKSRYRIVVL